MNELNVWSLAGELGLIIVIPLLFFLFIGVKIDLVLETKPMFILLGVVVAAVSSSVLIYRKIKKINAMENIV